MIRSRGALFLTIVLVLSLGSTPVAYVAAAGSTFSGMLRDRSGTPAPNQIVQLLGDTEQHVTTGVDGAFSLSVVPSSYRIRLLASGPAGSASVPNRYDLNGPGIDLRMDKVQDLTLQNVFLDVTVLDGSGQPVPNAIVDVPFAATTFQLFLGGTTSGGVAADGVRTNSAGIARLILFPSTAVSGTVTPPAGSGLPVTSFNAGAVLADKQITVTLSSAARFSGVLRDRSGNPASNQIVQLLGSTEQHITTGASGSFSLSVLPGNYQLRLLASGPAANAAVPNRYDITGPTLDLSADRVQDLRLQNVFLDVTVLNGAGVPVPNAVVDVPFAATSFEVFPGGTTNGGVAADGVRTNDAGIARLILFPSAAVIGTVAPPAGSGLPAASFDASAVLADKQITVTLSSPVGFTGVLRDRSGNPASNQIVQLLGSTEQHVTTGATGAFSFAVLSGDYRLRILASGPAASAAVPNRYDITGPTLQLSVDRVQDLTLQNVFLDVTVLDSSRAPVPDAVVDVPFAATSFEIFPGGTTSGGVAADGVRTNAAGTARLVLFPSAAVRGTVTPPIGSGLPAMNFDAGAVLGDKQITVRPPDTLPPDTAITDGPADGSVTKLTSAIFTFVGSDNATSPNLLEFECSLDGGLFTTCVSPTSYTGLHDGVHAFAVRAIDEAANTDPSPASRSWSVDTLPPSITCFATPAELWPPDHKLGSVTVGISASDESGSVQVSLLAVSSSQADSGLSEEDPPNDIQGWTIGTDDRSGFVRAERFEEARTYVVAYQAEDAAGNIATCETTITIRKSQGQ